jgi:trimethylamine--corrinoid protein Co-methyltransferase
MRAHFGVLSDAERERIHRDSLKILAEVGVRFPSSRARKLLAAHGASVNEDDRIVRIPAGMVEGALRTAPKTFTLGARNPAHDFPLPSAWTGYTLDGMATFATDFETGARRNGTARDIVDSLKIFERLPLGTVVWPNVMPGDIPVASANIRMTCLALTHSSKHVQHELHRPAEVPFLLEALRAVLGSEAAVRERKIFSVTYCTIPPLTHDEAMCDACLELARYRVPILPYPMPACGSTGPASLYSNIAVANAEGLSALVLFQLAEPGTPILFGHAAGIMHFGTGGFVEGAPESNLLNTGLGEMARFYGLPNTQAGCLTDAKAPGPQAVLEKMVTTLPLVLSGADVINGIGEIETSQLLVLEQIVVDHEIALLCRRLKDGIRVDGARDYLGDVARAGPGGNFLMEPGTLAACRNDEFCAPKLVDRNTYEAWMELGKPDLYSRARERVRELLAAPVTHPLPDAAIGRLEEVVRRADAELKEEPA